jgi:hypothetical protein
MNKHDTTDDDPGNRRRFLKLLGALGVTGLAGCGGDGTDTPTDTDAGGNGNGTDTPGTTADGTTTDGTTADGTTAPGTTTQPPASSPGDTETPPPTLTPREPEFVSLLEADSVADANWHKVHGQAEYEIRNGEIVGISDSNSPNSFLGTYKVYDDFVLEFEAWVDPDGLNSGIQVRSHTTANNPHMFGPQVELELSGDSAPQIAPGQSGYVYGERLPTGWMSGGGGNPPSHEVFNNGEWNDFRIRVEGDTLQTSINDEQIENLDLSQFSDVDALIGMGIIGLQVHSIGADGREVKWRNPRIKELDVAEWDRPFNGRNTDGWTNPRGAGDVSVSDGELRLSGNESFFLLTEESYEDFVFETWVNAGAKGGVMFRNPGENVVAGYRAEIDPTEDALSGSLYSVTEGEWLKNTDGESHSQMAYKPEGWNYYRVAADGENIRVWVNGITTANLSDDTEPAGGIGLQHRGGDGTIRFRDMEIKTLEESVLN